MFRWISTKSIPKLLILLPVLLLVALACGDDETPVPTSTTAPPTPTTAAVAPSATATPTTAAVATATPTTAAVAPTAVPTPTPTAVVSAAMPEGKVVFAVPDLGTEAPSIWQGSSINKGFIRFFAEPLIGSTDEGVESTKYGIADSWVLSPDGLTWKFTTRKGVNFSNGDPVTAEDSKFSIGLVMREDSISSRKTTFIQYLGEDPLANIDIPDPYTMVFNCVQACPLVIFDLSDLAGVEGFIHPKNYIEGLGDPNDFSDAPIGSGAYRLVRQRVGDFMEFEALDRAHWLRGVPKFKTARFRKIPEEATMVAAFRADEVDYIAMPRERIVELEAEGFNIWRKVDWSVIGFYFHEYWREDSVWNDIRAREAFNLAIDRDELCEFIFSGECSSNSMYPFPLVTPGYPDDLNYYGYDPDRARELLEQSGYAGEEIGIHAYQLSDTPEALRYTEALAGYLSAVGVKTKLIPTEVAKVLERRRSHTLDNQTTYFSAQNRPLGAWVSLMRAIGHTEGLYTTTSDPEIDRLIEAMEVSLDTNETLKLMGDLIRYENDNFTHLTVVNFNLVFATNDKITDYNPGKRPYDENYIQIASGFHQR